MSSVVPSLSLVIQTAELEERSAATGETIWREPTTHAVENVGDTEAHAIAIDLKTPGQH
jgi:hypothetical protein